MAVIKRLFFCSLFSSLAWSAPQNSFKETLVLMLEEDPDFKSIDFQTDYYEAKYKRDLTRLFLPTVSLSYGKYEQHNPATQVVSQEDYYAGSLTAALDVFSFGRDWSFYRSSEFEKKAQDQRVWSKLMEREAEIGNLLLTNIREANNLRILKSIVDLKEKALKISRERFRNGALSDQDLNKVRLDVSNAKGEYLIALQEFNQLKGRVKAFGVENPPLAFPWEGEFTPSRMKNLIELDTPVEKVPQFQELSLQYEADTHSEKGFFRSMLGSVQLSFTRSYLDFGSNDQWEWRAGLVYTIPLFDRFGQYTDYQNALARKRTSEIQQRFRKNLMKESQFANKSNLQVAYENFKERKEALIISGKLYDDSVRQFNRGQLSVNELLIDQDRLLRTEQIANQSLYQMHLAVINYCHAYGKAVVKSCFNEQDL